MCYFSSRIRDQSDFCVNCSRIRHFYGYILKVAKIFIIYLTPQLRKNLETLRILELARMNQIQCNKESNVIRVTLLKGVMKRAVSLVWRKVSGFLRVRETMICWFQHQMVPEALLVPTTEHLNISTISAVPRPNPALSQGLWWQLASVLVCCNFYYSGFFYLRLIWGS